MPRFRTGVVVGVKHTSPDGVQQLDVRIGDDVRAAVLFPRWTAPARAGDRVVVNVTAVDLDLGTGGADFIVWNHSMESYDAPSGGHIMKLRYTPAQCDVLAVESPESPHHEVMAAATTLDDAPVVATSLHSQLLPVLVGIRRVAPDARVAYVMTDGAALEAGFSNTLRALRDRGWIRGVVTAGHAVGGDLESVTVHSGLLAAKNVLDADLIVVGIGPGVVGTKTPYGTTAIDLGTMVLAAQSLGGRAVACVRLSEADPRARHRGVSNHMRVALGWVAGAIDRDRTCAVVPPGWKGRVEEVASGWRVVEEDPADVIDGLARAANDGLVVSHMGRKPADDELFFRAAAAAGSYAAGMLSS